ncbi:MAG: T9SS type A sorting domain-containing protein [Bacteroidota bacterium]
MKNKIYLTTLLLTLSLLALPAQNQVFYAGNAGTETFEDVVQLSDGTFLLAGSADNLDWLPPGTERIELTADEIANEQGTNKIGFILQLSTTLDTVLRAVYLPAGSAENIRYLKTTNAPRTPTADLYISGRTLDSEAGGYFIARLEGNFVDAAPTGLTWVYNVRCEPGDYAAAYQPWDVDGQGRVYYVMGDSHDWNWSALYRLNADGQQDVVEHWRTHWKTAGGEYRNTPASSSGEPLSHSGIVFKRDARCNLRSWTETDYNEVSSDGNGGTKRGKWPLDALFGGPCDPAGEAPTNGPGYTGYSPGSTFTYGPSSVCVDRRNGDLYLGLNAKSVLPDGNPDFEPAVMKMTPQGELLWWSRLYHEVDSEGAILNSSPDQYIDGLAVDYSAALPNSTLVVNARCHGNNVENFWEGNTIFNDPVQSGFQNRFTGTNGNIHISWLGKLAAGNGELQSSTYVAEMGQNTTGMGSPHPDPRLAAWPNPNAGWLQLNTTRLVQNTLKVTADGSVIVLGSGRRPFTTNTAHQQSPSPYGEGRSAWSCFVRQYAADFTLPVYSSILRGAWDTLSTEPPLNVEVNNVFKTADGLVVVGQHLGTENDLPVANIPAWGTATYQGESAFVAYLRADALVNAADNPVSEVVNTAEVTSKAERPIVFPNPTGGLLRIASTTPVEKVMVYTVYGQLVTESTTRAVDLTNWPAGWYTLCVQTRAEQSFYYQVFKQ